MSSGFAKPRQRRAHDILAGHVHSGAIPGLATAVSRHGEVHLDAIGSLAVGSDVPVAEDTIFRIASLSKPVTAVAAMILVEECVLRLDDPVDDLLPELADRQVLKSLDAAVDDTVPAERPITLRDLLTFRTGLGLILAMPGTYPIQAALAERLGPPGAPTPQVPPAPDAWMRLVGEVPLIHQPGAQWMYNTSADILGVLVARASGRPLDVFLSERIFEPLGMVDTGFSVPAPHIGRLSTSYARDPQTGALTVFDEAAGGQWSRPPVFPSGAGGLVSTARDFLRFGQMMLDGGTSGGERILTRPSVEAMSTDQLTDAQKAASSWMPGFLENWGWGFGMAVRTRRTSAESIGQYGWDGGMGTSWYADPREGLTGVLLTAVNWTSPIPPPVCRDFWAATYAAIDD
jgi:CubicO group peptidase (beta-lactamase class C family)